MSRDKRYQKLLNSKRWKELRAWKLAQTQGYCEICYREGWRGIDALAVDIHHIVPVESVIDQGEEAMKRVCYDPNNLMALCVRHHCEIHQQAGSHTKEAVEERKQKKRIGFLQRNDPNFASKREQDDACISHAEREQSQAKFNYKEEDNGTERNQETMCVSSPSDGQGGAARPDDTPTD